MVQIIINLCSTRTSHQLIYVESGIWTSSLLGHDCSDAYVLCNGKLVHDGDCLLSYATYHEVPRLRAGKGGFGSMLRAIGAQIEKTTNREACRDLSGRRMRDVNNEKQLSEWISKASDREKEKEERRKARLERLRAQPKHMFHDPKYDEQRSQMSEDLHDALEHGLDKAVGKRKAASAAEGCSDESKRKRMQKTDASWMGVDMADMSDSSSSDDSNDIPPSCIAAAATTSKATASYMDEPQPGPSGEGCTSSSLKDTETGESPIISASATCGDVQDKGAALVEENGCTLENDPEPAEFDLDTATCAVDLEQAGLDRLKSELISRGLKCGGTLQQRAERLYSVKGLKPDQMPSALLAKVAKPKKTR